MIPTIHVPLERLSLVRERAFGAAQHDNEKEQTDAYGR
jgi:hypothetical protein